MNYISDHGRVNRLRYVHSLGFAIAAMVSTNCISSAETWAVEPQAIQDRAELLAIQPIATDDQSPTTSRKTPIVRAIANAEAAVVNIKGNKTISTVAGSGTVKQEVSGMGTGVIIDPRGYIITNLHVVQDVPRIEVTLADGETAIAKLLNYDLDTDLAMIKIESKKPLPVIPFGTSHDLLRGETVVAIGNPFGYQNTVTVGVISALHRDVPVNGSQQYRDLIQTNADINPGNSGGPLLNINGEVVGINVAVRVGAQGIGFAIPIDQAIDVMADLIAAQNPSAPSHGVNLIRVVDSKGLHWQIQRAPTSEVQLTSTRRQDAVHPFQSDVPLQTGDFLVSVDGTKAPPRLALELARIDRRADDRVSLVVERNGTTLQTSLLLEPSSQESQRAAIAETELAWTQLGVRLKEVDADQVRTAAEEYQGGLKVVEVRPGSPAARQKIAKGDTIVGILSWQTPDWKALNWVLNNNDFKKSTNTRFYVVRNNRTFFVAMDLGQSGSLR